MPAPTCLAPEPSPEVAAPTGALQWRPITIEPKIVIGGGYQRQEHVLKTQRVDTGRERLDFVKVGLSDWWLHKIIGGRSCTRQGLNRIKIWQTVLSAASGSDAATAVAADAEVASTETPVADVDPMDALDDLGDTATPKKKQKAAVAAASAKKKRPTDAIITVEVPARSPLAHPSCTATRKITVLKKPCKGRNGMIIWIASRDLEWFLVALAEEHALGGISLEHDAAVADESTANGSHETENADDPDGGVTYRWDWEGSDGYVALFARGPHQGKEIASRVSTLTETKWNAAVAWSIDLHETCQGKTLHEASEAERRSAALVVLQLHCEGLMEAEKGD